MPLDAFTQSSETITISTYYPSPYGIYKTLRLYPDKGFDPDVACSAKGEMVYSDSDASVYVCNGSGWVSSGAPVVIYAEDLGVRSIKSIIVQPDPNPTFDEALVLKVPVKSQDTVKVSFSGMFEGPGYTGVWLTFGEAKLVSGWLPSSRVGALGGNWAPFQMTSFWKATADGVLVFQQGFYKADLVKAVDKDNAVKVNARFAFAEKVHLIPSK